MASGAAKAALRILRAGLSLEAGQNLRGSDSASLGLDTAGDSVPYLAGWGGPQAGE